MHRTRRAQARAHGGRERLVRDLAQHEALLPVAGGIGRLRHRQIGLVPHARCEHARLTGGLIRSDTAQLRRTVGRQKQQRNAGVVRLEGGGQQVRDRGSRRADHDRRHPGLSSDAEGGESGDALVDADVQTDRPAPLVLGRDEGERLRTGSGAQHDVLDTELDQPAQERRGGVGGGGLQPGSPRCHGQPTAPR